MDDGAVGARAKLRSRFRSRTRAGDRGLAIGAYQSSLTQEMSLAKALAWPARPAAPRITNHPSVPPAEPPPQATPGAGAPKVE
jgi:hypothetical protein